MLQHLPAGYAGEPAATQCAAMRCKHVFVANILRDRLNTTSNDRIASNGNEILHLKKLRYAFCIEKGDHPYLITKYSIYFALQISVEGAMGAIERRNRLLWCRLCEIGQLRRAPLTCLAAL